MKFDIKQLKPHAKGAFTLEERRYILRFKECDWKVCKGEEEIVPRLRGIFIDKGICSFDVNIQHYAVINKDGRYHEVLMLIGSCEDFEKALSEAVESW